MSVATNMKILAIVLAVSLGLTATARAVAAPEQAVYGYDALGRLILVVRNRTIVRYSYDMAGNRIAVSVGAPVTPPSPPSSPPFNTTLQTLVSATTPAAAGIIP